MATLDFSNPLLNRVRTVIAQQVGDAVLQLPRDADLRTSLGEAYDSLTATECVYAVEKEFGIAVDFTNDDVRFWFASLERIGRFVADRLEDSEVAHAAV